MRPIHQAFLTLCTLLGISICLQPDVFSQQVAIQEPGGDYRIEAYRLAPNETINLDGRLNEPFWQKAKPVSNFTQQQPGEGEMPSQKTEVRVAYDDEYLYISAILYDEYPENIIAHQKRRDESLATDDRFMWILDTFNDGRNAYFFETNPAGLRGDGLVYAGQGRNVNKAWDGIWDIRTSITSEGWILEAQIPFRTLDFNPNNTVWGINFQRTIRRDSEEILWAGWRRNQGLFRPQNSGLLTGLESLNQGLGLEVTPFVTGAGNRSWHSDGVSDFTSADAGFDISYNITPSLRTALTVNTDFAETEVDDRRVNLSRFSLIFREQRDFFLEGASLFNFASASGVIPFFSRRIGLVDGAPIPLDIGAKVLGRTGNTNIGFYQIRTGNQGEINSEDFTIARISQNILEESRIGLIYTRRATLDDDFYLNRNTLGFDFDLNTSNFLGDKNLQFQAFYVGHDMHTADEGSSLADRSSTGIRLSFPNYPFSGNISYRQFGSDFNPAVGLANRVSLRRFQPTISYERILEDNTLIRSWETTLYFEYLTDLQFNPETINLTFTPLDIRLESGDRITGDIVRNYERLDFNFDILRDGNFIISPGGYYNWSTRIRLNTASYRRISGSAEFTYEGFWTGHRTAYDVSLTVRPLPGINLSADFSRTDAALPDGSFQTDLARFTGNVDLTPRIAFTNMIQFDNLSNLLGLYNRFRWTLRPGADIYLVHTYNWIQIDRQFSPLETEGAIKLSFTHRF